MDLLSAVITLRAETGASNLEFLGRYVRSFFLTGLIGGLGGDPALAETLHKERGSRPYTVSTLMRDNQSANSLAPGEMYWLRFTTLTDELSAFFMDKVLGRINQNLKRKKNMPVSLGKHVLKIQGFMTRLEEHPWAGRGTYAAIAEQALRSDEQRFRFQFASPTSFRSNGMDVPLPIPTLVFGSYWNSWKTFSGGSTHLDMREFTNKCVAVNETSVQSTRRRFKFSDGNQPGVTCFQGGARFALLKHNRKLFHPDWEHGADLLRMLAEFAFYCGTGLYTTYGLGQTRPLPPRRNSSDRHKG